ncbi:hypothetical protein Taro_009186, partial [Colocasia esculenta]|nr:hypothetical protein [Colocasia esculenta]
LLLKPSCGGCGSTTDLYGNNCKHMTLCLSCGKTMAENCAKCYECGATITMLIRVRLPSPFALMLWCREYNVRASTSSDKNFSIGRFVMGLPPFSRKKSAENKWSLQKEEECGENITTDQLKDYVWKTLNNGKLTADWFSREEYEKFTEDLQGKIIHIDAQSASTSNKVKRGPTLLRSIHGLQSNECILVNVNQLGQPLGEGWQLLKQFLGTVERMGDKLPIDCISWRVMPSSNKDDVWDYIQRKFDVPISLRDFVMKDLDQKWRSWKYDLRTKFFTPYQKAQQHFACSDRRVFLKIGATLDRGDLFIRTRMKKAGGQVNDESASMIV